MLYIIALLILIVVFFISITIEIIQLKKKDSFFKMAYRNLSGLTLIIISLTMMKEITILAMLFCIYGSFNIIVSTIKMRNYI